MEQRVLVLSLRSLWATMDECPCVSRGTSRSRELPQPHRREDRLHREHLAPAVISARDEMVRERWMLPTEVRTRLLGVDAVRSKHDPSRVGEEWCDVPHVLPRGSARRLGGHGARPSEVFADVLREQFTLGDRPVNRSAAADDPSSRATSRGPDCDSRTPTIDHVDPGTFVRKTEYDDAPRTRRARAFAIAVPATGGSSMQPICGDEHGGDRHGAHQERCRCSTWNGQLHRVVSGRRRGWPAQPARRTSIPGRSPMRTVPAGRGRSR